MIGFGFIFLLAIIVICLSILCGIYMYLKATIEHDFMFSNRFNDLMDEVGKIYKILKKMENK